MMHVKYCERCGQAMIGDTFRDENGLSYTTYSCLYCPQNKEKDRSDKGDEYNAGMSYMKNKILNELKGLPKYDCVIPGHMCIDRDGCFISKFDIQKVIAGLSDDRI